MIIYYFLQIKLFVLLLTVYIANTSHTCLALDLLNAHFLKRHQNAKASVASIE